MGVAILIGLLGVTVLVVILSVIGLAMFVAHVLHSAFVAVRSLFHRGSSVPPALRRRG